MRLIVGLLFACHGGQKILGFPSGGHGMPSEMIGAIGAWIELAGGFLVAFGFLTRLAAFIASGEMAVAYFVVHVGMGFFPIVNHGESAVFYAWFFFFVVFYGPGRWSIDAIFGKGRAITVAAAVAFMFVAQTVTAQEFKDLGKDRLNSSPRHADWIDLKSGSRTIEAFVVYPEREDKAPAVLVIQEIVLLTVINKRISTQINCEVRDVLVLV